MSRTIPSQDVLEVSGHSHAKYRVPIKYQTRVCMCNEFSGVLFANRKPGPFLSCCVTCKKPFRYYVRHCTGCNDWFLKDFRRKEFDCPRHSLCFKCIESGEYEPCDCYPINTKRLDFGPFGLNPREVSKEAMDSAFDFKSPFD